MNDFIAYIPDLLEVVGTIMIAWAALKVHHRVLHQHKIDKTVYEIMHFEQRIGIIGVILLAIGFLLRILL